MSLRRSDWLVSLGLFAGSAAVRIPFRSEHLFQSDSYRLAAGVLYTLVAHPPGFIGYCALVRGVYLFAGDVNLAFVIVNLVATGIATALTYLLARQMFDRPTGVIAAVLYATSVNTSYFAEVALSYAAEGMFATAAALTAWLSVRRNSFPWLLIHTAVLAIGGSVRQTTLAFLFPLWLWVVWRSTRDWSKRAAAAAVLCAIVALWAVPNARRLSQYWAHREVGYLESVYNLQVAMEQYYDASEFGAVRYERPAARFHWPLVEFGVALWNRIDPPAADASPEVRAASAVNALRMMRYQTAKLLFYAVMSMGAATLFLLLAFRRRVRESFGRDHAVFLALWIVPAAAFFALNHFGTWGYLLLFLAALCAIAARTIAVLFASTRSRAIVTSLVVLPGVAFFLFAKPLPESTERNRLIDIAVAQYSAPSIRMHYARARSSAFTSDPRQLTLRCFTDECLKASIKHDFDLPAGLAPVTPLR